MTNISVQLKCQSHPLKGRMQTVNKVMSESHSGIKITDVRVSKFRAINHCELLLGDVRILLGANNAGKPNFLDAFYAAIGSGQKLLDGMMSAERVLRPFCLRIRQ